MNEGGLVGRVIQLGERSSRILLVTDFNSRVPVIGEVSGVHAIMQGGSTSSGTLTDLPERSEFIEGERILTSSEGGAYPRGLVVGDVQKSGNDWRVKYAMSDGSSGYVQLIPPPTVERPISAGDLPALGRTSASPTQGARR
jgi:rod shape-determining protein MreC